MDIAHLRSAPTELLIFCRRPAPGRIKTRLAAVVGDGPATELYRAFVADILATAAGVRAGAARICYAPEHGPDGASDAQIEQALAALQREAGTALPTESQVGGDLGRRMAGAAAGAFARGARAAVIIGTDCPQMDAAYIGEALAVLVGPDAPQVVLGPSADGGYVLVGARPPLPGALFDGIPWSTGEVLRRTTGALEAAGVTYRLLAPSFDVDTADDLPRLREAIDRLRRQGARYPRRTAEVLARLDARDDRQ